METKEVEKNDSGYTRLLVAVQDLLSELRIDESCLSIMADGMSPDYPGVGTEDSWQNPYTKVQISKLVARKLINAGVINHKRT